MKTTCWTMFDLLLLSSHLQAKRHQPAGRPAGISASLATRIPSTHTVSGAGSISSSTPRSPEHAENTRSPAYNTSAPSYVTSPAAPLITSAAGSEGDPGEGAMTIEIINSWKAPISVSFGNNAGGPTPVGNPQAGPLPSSTSYAFPTGWAGRIYVGPGPAIDPNGSKIEGSVTGDPDIDVSYVDGYSVPITCSVGGKAITGCNIDLFAQPGITCANKVAGPVCHNSAQGIPDGPAPSFFAACAGAAYTFPNDDDANVGDLTSNTVSCCVGTSCSAPARQESQNTMEFVSEMEKGRVAMAPSLLPRHTHRRGRHPGLTSKGQN